MDDFLKGAMLERMALMRMEAMVKELHDMDSRKGTPFDGLAILDAIMSVSEEYKKNLIEEKDSLGFSKGKIEEIIENVVHDLREKLLE